MVPGDGAEVLVALDGMAFGPEAVGTQVGGGAAAGRRTFVLGGAPGETVRARLRAVRGGGAHAQADLLAVEQAAAAPARTEPRCPLVGRCGGCQWQHLRYGVQVAQKRRLLARALGVAEAVVAVTASPRQFGYRSRARLHLEDGALGYRPLRGGGVVDVEACPLLDEPAAAALARLRAVLVGQPLRAEVLIAGPDVALRVEGSAAARAAQALAPRLVDVSVSVPGRGGGAGTGTGAAVRAVAIEDTQAARGARGPVLAAGQGDPARAFHFEQANPEANALLVAAVLEAARDLGPLAGRRVLELYAGAGNFTRALIAAGAAVTAVESDPAALPALALCGAHVEAGEAAAVTARLAAQARAGNRGRAEIVVLDPPRSGAGPTVQGLLGLAAARIVYVSCDPATLARDVQGLARQYELAGVRLVDLFPQTYHLEAVALLRCRADAR
jgi:23S rRNA (uracil1939-C5)-methyltransferase